MTYEEAAAYFAGIPPFVPRKVKPGEELFNLDLIRVLLMRLGNPEKKIAAVHITGTNGKGSTSAFLTQMLTEGGYKTGLYTSPAMTRITERIRIGLSEIPEAAFAACAERVRAEAEKMAAAGEGSPSEFEQVTALAFLYFAEEACDIAVIEAGLGGRLDATNVIPAPLLAIFTPVSFDHMEVLGDTLALIAAEKAGIIKPGTGAVLSAPQEEEVLQVLKGRAAEMGVPFYAAGVPDKDASSSAEPLPDNAPGDVSLHETVLPDSTLRDVSFAGSYQRGNASLAAAAVRLLADRFPVSEAAVRRGAETMRWPGRYELMQTDPCVIADGAHNAAGVRTLMESLSGQYPGKRFIFITGVLADKQVDEMLDAAAPYAKMFFTVTPDSVRALPAEALCERLRERGLKAEVCESAAAAVRRALDAADVSDVICAFGSFYFIGKVRSCFSV